MTISERIKLIMKLKGYTIYKLAQEIAITTGCLSKILKDKCEPKLSTLKKIACELNVTVSYLIGEEELDYSYVSPKMLEYIKGFSLKEQDEWIDKTLKLVKKIKSVDKK